MKDEFWLILESQPGVGVLIVDRDGVVLFCNEQAKEIYYGHNFNPVGMTIEQVEGPEFAAERMPVIQKVRLVNPSCCDMFAVANTRRHSSGQCRRSQGASHCHYAATAGA